MTDTYNQLKDELSILYPDVTDIELTEMTDNLINFYKIAVEAVLEEKKQTSKEFAVDDTNFKNNLFPLR